MTISILRARNARDYFEKQIERDKIKYGHCIQRLDAEAAKNILDRMKKYEIAVECINMVLGEGQNDI